jgi:hypothetical protein
MRVLTGTDLKNYKSQASGAIDTLIRPLLKQTCLLRSKLSRLYLHGFICYKDKQKF